jgi:hypothetical protein
MDERMKFYRYEDVQYTDGPRIHELVLYLVRETPCGYWISPRRHYNEADEDKWFFYYGDRKRWVSKTTRKRYAYPTKAEAMANFKARKRRQIDILEYRLNRAKKALQSVCEGPEELKQMALWLEGTKQTLPLGLSMEW